MIRRIVTTRRRMMNKEKNNNDLLLELKQIYYTIDEIQEMGIKYLGKEDKIVLINGEKIKLYNKKRIDDKIIVESIFNEYLSDIDKEFCFEISGKFFDLLEYPADDWSNWAELDELNNQEIRYTNYSIKRYDKNVYFVNATVYLRNEKIKHLYQCNRSDLRELFYKNIEILKEMGI
ncbi:MAG: hypothetical protein JXA54_11335 [Candidatus Heimdallarchaeota archaeon]|nr:hypothetical protein [Candidatus Heimdallarchaeota archaeon]